MQMIPRFVFQWMRTTKLWCIILYYSSDLQFHLHVLQKQPNNNGDWQTSRELPVRKKKRILICSPKWTVIWGFIRNSTFPFQCTIKRHWLCTINSTNTCLMFALLRIHSTNGFIARTAIHFVAQTFVYFICAHSIWNAKFCRIVFPAWIQRIRESNGDTKSMLIYQFFFLLLLLPFFFATNSHHIEAFCKLPV